jgi:hypothetical protein
MTNWTLRILAVELIVIAGLLTLALDIYAHKRVEMVGGLNVWGYRGPVAHHRQPRESRVVIVGGTRAFGWGQPASALASEIRRLIMLTTDRRGAELRPVVVINLGRLGALPDSYSKTIEHFAYLAPDYICLFDDLGVPGAASTEPTSAVFELTGYSPAVPLVLREKGMIWRFGDVKRGYASPEARHGAPTSLVGRTAGSTLTGIGRGLEAVDRWAARMLPSGNRVAAPRHETAADYADAMMTAVESAHVHARGVLVVLSPSETPEQARNLRALRLRLNGENAAPWLQVVDLGTEAELSDHALRLDGWNYSAAGIAAVAARIAPALLTFIVKS